MKKLFAFKKLSWKIALIVGVAVAIVAGSLSIYLQSRVMHHAGNFSQENLIREVNSMAEESNNAFTSATFGARSMRLFGESIFDLEAFKRNPQDFFDSVMRRYMDDFVVSVIENSPNVSAAYFSPHPDLAGFPFVVEIYFADSDEGIVSFDPITYEEYMEEDSEDMTWFYGAYNSGKPYWTHVYEDDGITMVSYVEPVIVDGMIIGVTGVDIFIDDIEEKIRAFKAYDTGFALIEDNYGGFFQTNDIAAGFSSSELDHLTSVAKANPGNVFDIRLGGEDFVIAARQLVNDYILYILVPKNEFNAVVTTSLVSSIAVFIVALIISLFIAYLIGRAISSPFVTVSKELGRIANGDFSKPMPQRVLDIPDETGQLAKAAEDVRIRFAYLTEKMLTIADGDLTEEIQLAYDGDTIGLALNNTMNTLNGMFSDLLDTSRQLGQEAEHLTDAGSLLAQGVSKQSGSVDKLTKTMSVIMENNKANLAMLEKAVEFEEKVKQDAQLGSQNMSHLANTVREISEASKGIHHVLKAIDDIAFQTNILALNAAVEAARAGQHGKGFAVVAEEVRALAAKSADAAKETAQLVDISTEKAAAGERLAAVTADSFSKIADGIVLLSDEVISKIEQNSRKNNEDVSVMITDIGVVSGVVHETASNSQRTEAMAGKINDQATLLKGMVQMFKIKNDNTPRISGSDTPRLGGR